MGQWTWRDGVRLAPVLIIAVIAILFAGVLPFETCPALEIDAATDKNTQTPRLPRRKLSGTTTRPYPLTRAAGAFSTDLCQQAHDRGTKSGPPPSKSRPFVPALTSNHEEFDCLCNPKGAGYRPSHCRFLILMTDDRPDKVRVAIADREPRVTSVIMCVCALPRVSVAG
jgi:hypothetical protein